MTGVTDILGEIGFEVRRQIFEEGYTAQHDDEHQYGELAGAAACYALANVGHWRAPAAIAELWPKDWEPIKSDDHRRSLLKAGALIVAEIARLDRKALQAGSL